MIGKLLCLLLHDWLDPRHEVKFAPYRTGVAYCHRYRCWRKE